MYEIYPLIATPERAHILSKIMRSIAFHETVFSDYQQGCDEKCTDKALEEMCPLCLRQMELISRALTAPHTRVWEVWDLRNEPEIVGVVYFCDVIPGVDATGHYVFFDRDLVSKTGIIKRVIEWAFEDHDDWTALRRITVEIPAYAKVLARHAHKKLGFGGRFSYKRLRVEGVKEAAVRWRGRDHDVYVMGLLRQ